MYQPESSPASSRSRYLKEARITYRKTRVRLPDSPIQNSKQAAAIFKRLMPDNGQEQFHVLGLNSNNRAVAWCQLNTGMSSYCEFDLKALVRWVCLTNSESIILAHNHPSDVLTASNDDVTTFKHLRETLKQLSICVVLDALVLDSNGEYLSIAVPND